MSMALPTERSAHAARAERVALIEPVGGHGGMDYYDLGLCRGLVAAGWQVGWYTCHETTAPTLAGLSFHPVYKGIWGKANRWKRAALYLLGSVRALLSATFAGERVCHLHFFNGAPEELMLLTLAKLFGRKVVVTVHDVESFAGAGASARGVISRIYGFADHFIVHNQTSRQELISSLGADAARIAVIPHGNYLDTLGSVPSVADARHALGIVASAKVALFFGQIKQVKGLDLLIGAMPEVASAVPDVVLVIAGRPWKNDFAQYQDQIEQQGISARCKLHIRFIPDSEVGLFYAAADVVVLPYRHIYQSGVVLLAMSYGRAVLVSDLPGMTEIVSDGDTGYIFRSGSKAALADALTHLLSDDESRRRTAERGFRYVQTHHDWMRIAAQTAAVYAAL